MIVEALGRQVIAWSEGTIELFRLGVESVWAVVSQIARGRFRFEETLTQMHVAAVQTLPVVSVGLLFLSLMLITEFSFHMKLVLRQDSLVPAFSTVLLLRELGPVVTALLIASRVGAGTAAEIATMKATEQIDALRLMAIDPVEFLVPARWIATVFSTVSLTLIALGVGILGGAVLSAFQLGYGVGEFFNTMFVFARLSDLAGCGLKAAAFGTLIPLMAVHQGLRSQPGSQGVGDAATGAVVAASVGIIATDFLITLFLNG